MSADEPTMSVEKPTISPGDTTMSADEPTMSPEDQHTQMLDPSRSQSSKSPQSAPSAPAQARTHVNDGLAVKLEQLRAFYGDVAQVKGIDLDFHANEVTAIIGPSGCGKSTMVRCINRMHEEVPGARAEGRS